MATAPKLPHDDSHERISISPHEASKADHHKLPRWALPLLGGLAVMATGVTFLRMAWHGDQGGTPQVTLGSNTEPSKPTTLRPDANPSAKMVGEQDEDAPLPNALPFDEYVARTALELRARDVRCGQAGQVELKVSFSPSGTSTRVEPAAATRAGRCAASRLEGITIPAFQGNEERQVTVKVALR